jgi:hypothetical protein
MLNTLANPLFTAWVKNVHNMCLQYGMNCVRVFTAYVKTYTRPIPRSVKPQFYTQLTTSFTPVLYTAFSRIFNLLNGLLYTVSTAPINSKKK